MLRVWTEAKDKPRIAILNPDAPANRGLVLDLLLNEGAGRQTFDGSKARFFDPALVGAGVALDAQGGAFAGTTTSRNAISCGSKPRTVAGLTIQVRVKWLSGAQVQTVLLCVHNWNQASTYGPLLSVSGTQSVSCNWNTTAGWVGASGVAGLVPAGEWRDICVSFDGHLCRAYVDGVAAGNTFPYTVEGDAVWPDVPLLIGQHYNDYTRAMNGWLGHVAIWDVGQPDAVAQALSREPYGQGRYLVPTGTTVWDMGAAAPTVPIAAISQYYRRLRAA